MDTVSVFAGLYALSAIVALGVAAWLARHRTRPGANAFTALLVLVAVWALIDAVSLLRSDLFAKIFWQTIAHVLVAYVPALWLLFTLQYTGRFTASHRSIALALGLEATAVAALILTNDFQWLVATPLDPLAVDGHWLFWRTYEYHIEPVALLGTVPGPLFVLRLVFSYVLVAIGTLFLLQVVVAARDAHRSQPALLVAAIGVPITLNVGAVVGWLPGSGLDYTPIGIGLASAIIAWAVYRHRLFDVYPVASDAVMRGIRDAVLVVTEDGLVADYNPAGRDLLSTTDPLGTPVSEAVPFDLDLDSSAGVPRTLEPTASIDGNRRHFLLDVTSLDDHRQHGGTVLIFRDVTERRRQRRELERQAEHMERFATTVSHDLRNPLNVAQGGVELLPDDADGAELLRESHDRMQTIIDDSLAFARSGQRISEADTEPVALERVARTAWGTIDTADATLTVDGSLRLIADDRRLQRLLENLYRNAIEHGTADVDVRVEPLSADGSADDDSDADTVADPNADHRVERADPCGFAVADDGPGIPPDERDAVLENGYTTRTDGTGFGLAIVTAIARAHDWDVRVTESRRGGARLEFRGCRVCARFADPESPGHN